MPIGNGHIAANVNYESKTNSLAVLVSASSSWGEDGELLKVNCVHLYTHVVNCDENGIVYALKSVH